MLLKFPKNFMWGSAMSALQSEGAGTTDTGATIWTTLYDKDPGYFYAQASPKQGVDSMSHYEEDIANMKQYGHNSFRNSFSWTRLFPDGKKADPKAVKYYHDYLQAAGKAGLTRVMTAQHFDVPQFIQDQGGYLNPKYPEIFANYCDFLLSEYGNELEIFATYNEPNVEIVYGYLEGARPPMLSDPTNGIKAWKSQVLSHAKVCELFDKKYRGKLKTKMSFVHNIHPILPKDNITYSKEDQLAATRLNGLQNFSFMDAMVLGKVAPELVELCKSKNIPLDFTKEELALLAKSHLDCVGINFYSVGRVSAPAKESKNGSFLQGFVSSWTWDKARMNPFRGWEIYPEGFGIIADWVKNRYKNIPYWIAENGMAVQEEWRWMDKDGMVQDDYRIAFLSEHLAQLHKDIANGANCIGYHMWSTYDCWSMANGHKNTYGFIRVDIPTMKRYPKKSAHWYKEVLRQNGFDDGFKRVDQVIDLKTKAIPSPTGGFASSKKK